MTFHVERKKINREQSRTPADVRRERVRAVVRRILFKPEGWIEGDLIIAPEIPIGGSGFPRTEESREAVRQNLHRVDWKTPLI